MQRLVIQSLLLQVSQPPLLEFGRGAKTGRGEKRFMVAKSGGFRPMHVQSINLQQKSQEYTMGKGQSLQSRCWEN